ncbi:MAG: putative membrane protein [Planctomycetaceae bacterium]
MAELLAAEQKNARQLFQVAGRSDFNSSKQSIAQRDLYFFFLAAFFVAAFFVAAFFFTAAFFVLTLLAAFFSVAFFFLAFLLPKTWS